MDFKITVCPAFEHIGGGLLGLQQRRHGEFVLCGQRRSHKTWIDHADTNTKRREIEIQRFSQVDHGCFGGAIGQAIGQSAVACNAGNQADVTPLLLKINRQDSIEYTRNTQIVHVLVLHHFF